MCDFYFKNEKQYCDCQVPNSSYRNSRRKEEVKRSGWLQPPCIIIADLLFSTMSTAKRPKDQDLGFLLIYITTHSADFTWSLLPVCYNIIFNRSVMSNKTRLMLIYCNILIKFTKLLVMSLTFKRWITIPKLSD